MRCCRSNRPLRPPKSFGVVAAVTAGGAFAGTASAQTLQTQYQTLVSGTTSLQNYWNFEDNLGGNTAFSSVADVAGGKDGTVVGSVTQVSGLVGNAGSFPGDSDSGTINNFVDIVGSNADTSFDLTGSFTVEALVKTDQLPADNWSGVVTKGDSAWRIARNRGDNYIQGAANGLESSSNAFHDLDNDVWHYLAIRYDQTTGAFTTVFDDASITEFANPGDSVDTNAFNVMIGANAERPEREWLGLIDEVAIYNAALDDSEIDARITLLDSDPGAIDQADVAYWTGDQPTGSMTANPGWNDDAPQSPDAVIIGKGGDVSIAAGESVTVESLEIGSEQDIIGNPSSGDGTLRMTGGELTITGGGDTTVGEGATGEVIQSGDSKISYLADDWELGDRPNGNGKHTLSDNSLLEIGSWYAVPDASDADTVATAGFYMENGSGGDDISIGRERTDDPGETAVGELVIENDAEVRVANDAFIPDVGEGYITMRDNAVMRIGDDARAGSADGGVGAIDMSGDSRMVVGARMSIADSTDSQVDVTLDDNATIEIGRYMAVGGKDNLDESGVGTLTLNGSAKVDIGAILFRGDLGDADDIGVDPADTTQTIAEQIGNIRRIADDHQLFVGAGPNGEGSGVVNQDGADSVMTVGREANIGFTASGEYYLRGGLLEVRGDAPIESDFASLPDNDAGNGNGVSGFQDRGGDLIIGREASGDGLLSVEGGDLSVNRDLVVGFDGVGRLRVSGGDSAINVGGDFSIGGNFAAAAAQNGTLEIGLTGSSQQVSHSAINVNGGTEGIPGDVYLYGADLEVKIDSVYADYRPVTGDTITLIDYAGSVLGDGAFAGITDATVDGIDWRIENDTTNTLIQIVADAVAIDGDADFNGEVGLSDLNQVLNNFGETEAIWAQGDMDNTGDIGLADLNVVLNNFGDDTGIALATLDAFDAEYVTSGDGISVTAITIPEPSTVIVFAGAAGIFLTRRRCV